MVAISVDRDFARFGSKSYAINKINTVDVRERKPFGMGAAIICGIICFFCLMGALGTVSDPNARGGAVVSLLIGAFFGWLTYRSWMKSQIVEYQLFLMTSSSEAQAFTSRDADEVFGLREQIEAAMAGR